MNLDNIDSKLNEHEPITVGGKDFTIITFPIACSILYKAACALSQKSFDKHKEYQKLVIEAGETDNPEDVDKITDILKKIEDENLSGVKLEDELRKKLLDCVQILLEVNNHEYDEKFWLTHCDDIKLWQFLHLAANRGILADYLKKKSPSVPEAANAG